MNVFRKILVIGLLFTFFYSCEYEEGEGGNSTIMGRVLVKNYNSDFSVKISEYYASDIDVFIIYGNDSIYADDFKTGIDGWYRFQYLQKGTYTVYAFSADSSRTSPSGIIPVSVSTKITDNNSTIILEDIVIFD